MTNESFYDPSHPPSWDAEVEFEFVNLTAEQTELAKRIIDENRVIQNGLINVLKALSKAGFRGKVVVRPQLFLPPLIIINSKVEKDITI